MTHVDLAIIGTGSGNSILDHRFADRSVALIERGTFGGTCLNVGCIPTKMLVHTADVAATPASAGRFGVEETLDAVHWPQIRDRVFGRIDPIAYGGRTYRLEHSDNENVTVYEGTAVFTGHKQLAVTPNDGGPTETITADQIVIAAGSRPTIPPIDGLDQVPFHTSDTVMRLDELPRRMAIVGGGFVAAEFAHIFSSLGCEVTLIARSGALLRAEDTDVSETFTELVSRHWDVRLETQAHAVEQVGSVTRLHLDGPGGPATLECDALLIATGRTPNGDRLDVAATGLALDEAGLVPVDEYQRTAVDGIWALGDVSSHYALKHVANHEERVVQHNLLHADDADQLVASDHRYVPHAVFSSPQIASVGLTEKAAEEAGRRYVTAQQEYGTIAYGWAMEEPPGFLKLIADPETAELLGAHIIGPQASTLIQPLIQAMSFGLDARRMARGQYWIHPAMPELVENALLALPLEE